MHTCSIKWSYSCNSAGVFLYKSSSSTEQSWHCIIGFLINATHLSVYFILHYHLFFRKKLYLFKYLYFSEYDIWMFLYVFWLRKEHQLSKYATGGGWGRVIQNAYSCVKGDFFVQKLGLSFKINICSPEVQYYYHKLNGQVVSGIAERFKT